MNQTDPVTLYMPDDAIVRCSTDAKSTGHVSVSFHSKLIELHLIIIGHGCTLIAVENHRNVSDHLIIV